MMRLLVFKNRVAIVSPGILPNLLTIDNILNGNSVIINTTIVSNTTKILP